VQPISADLAPRTESLLSAEASADLGSEN